MNALAPEKSGFGTQGPPLGQPEIDGCLQVHMVCRADKGNLAEIGSLREESIERLQARIRAVPIAALSVNPSSEATVHVRMPAFPKLPH
jgi:hypothetical protein